MEYSFKQTEAADMCQRIISLIVGKYIDKILEAKNDRVDLTVRHPHSEDTGMKIVIEVSKDGNTTIKGMPLKTVNIKRGDLWSFIESYLPDYYHRDDILHFDIYSRYVENEDVCESDLQWIYNDYGSDKGKVRDAIDQMEKEFAYEALVCWLENHEPESW